MEDLATKRHVEMPKSFTIFFSPAYPKVTTFFAFVISLSTNSLPPVGVVNCRKFRKEIVLVENKRTFLEARKTIIL